MTVNEIENGTRKQLTAIAQDLGIADYIQKNHKNQDIRHMIYAELCFLETTLEAIDLPATAIAIAIGFLLAFASVFVLAIVIVIERVYGFTKFVQANASVRPLAAAFASFVIVLAWKK